MNQLAVISAILLALLFQVKADTCVVESVNCTFPFELDGVSHDSCAEGSPGSNKYFCFSQIGEKYVYGQCNGGCFEEDGSPMLFNSSFGYDDVMLMFCKTMQTPCIFPFTWNGKEYSGCTSDGSEFPWCAVEVDSDNNLVNNRWGKCDMSTCEESAAMPTSAPVVSPKTVSVSFENVEGAVKISQQSGDDVVTLEGSLAGLDENDGPFTAYICDGPCESMDETCKVLGMLQNSGEEPVTHTLDTQDWSITMFADEPEAGNRNSVAGKYLAIKTGDVLEFGEQNNVVPGKTISCAVIPDPDTEDTTQLIIIILVVVVVVLILILLIVICCCCCRKRKGKKKEKAVVDYDSIDDPVGNGTTKTPLYDELSIPFIDASLPPTPKMGRSTDQLAILLGRGSKSSLSSLGKSESSQI